MLDMIVNKTPQNTAMIVAEKESVISNKRMRKRRNLLANVPKYCAKQKKQIN
jgi:hypothetical protein